MFNFLLRKDVRKILKRKDSDAGEKGTNDYYSLKLTFFFFFLEYEFHSAWSFFRLAGFGVYQCGLSLDNVASDYSPPTLHCL